MTLPFGLRDSWFIVTTVLPSTLFTGCCSSFTVQDTVATSSSDATLSNKLCQLPPMICQLPPGPSLDMVWQSQQQLSKRHHQTLPCGSSAPV